MHAHVQSLVRLKLPGAEAKRKEKDTIDRADSKEERRKRGEERESGGGKKKEGQPEMGKEEEEKRKKQLKMEISWYVYV
jgi:hypothetical protein